MSLPANYRDRHVEVLHNGNPAYIITLNESSDAHAIRRACSAVWMQALRDGREWPRETITGRIASPELVAQLD